MTFKGAWVTGYGYATNDAVTYGTPASTYIALTRQHVAGAGHQFRLRRRRLVAACGRRAARGRPAHKARLQP